MRLIDSDCGHNGGTMDSTRGEGGCLFYGAHQIAQLLINSQITFPQQKYFKLKGGTKKREITKCLKGSV